MASGLWVGKQVQQNQMTLCNNGSLDWEKNGEGLKDLSKKQAKLFLKTKYRKLWLKEK